MIKRIWKKQFLLLLFHLQRLTLLFHYSNPVGLIIIISNRFMKSLTFGCQHSLNTSSTSLLENDHIQLLQPKYNHARLKFSKDSKSLSPWITLEHHMVSQSQLFQPVQPTFRNHKLMNIASRAIKEANARKKSQVSQFQYKLKNTLVQFRVKSLSQSGKKYRVLKESDNDLEEKMNESRKDKKRTTFFVPQLQKTPKMKFLERKLRVKQTHNSSFKRKNIGQIQRQSSLNMAASTQEVQNEERSEFKKFGTGILRNSRKLHQFSTILRLQQFNDV